VFQTIAANNIDFLWITEAFLTTRGGWQNSDSDLRHDYYQAIQNTLLDGQYRDTTRFDNISTTECYSRYTSPFIKTGNGFGIIPLAKNYNSTLLWVDAGPAKLGSLTEDIHFLCKFSSIRACA
jgi:hypothetical protein